MTSLFKGMVGTDENNNFGIVLSNGLLSEKETARPPRIQSGNHQRCLPLPPPGAVFLVKSMA